MIDVGMGTSGGCRETVRCGILTVLMTKGGEDR